MILDSLRLNYPEFIKKNKKNIKIKNFVLNEGLIHLEKKNHKFLQQSRTTNTQSHHSKI